MITFNGKPFEGANFTKSLNRGVVEEIAKQIKAKIDSVLSEEEADQLKIDINGEDIEAFAFDVDGPDGIVRKVEELFSK